LTRLDAGCSFRPRCRFAVEACASARPPLQQTGSAAHFAACFRSAEIGGATAEPARERRAASGVAAS
ncbi:MAG: hypothetical protein WCA23_09975, partial [Stellaceae bacterium]